MMGSERMDEKTLKPEGRIVPRSRRAAIEVLRDPRRGDLTPGPFPTREGVTSPTSGPRDPPPVVLSGSPSLVGKGPGVRSQSPTPNTPSPATLLSRLRERFRQAVAAELCPDERLEFIAQPSRDKIGRLKGASLAGLSLQFTYLVGHLNAGDPLEALGLGFWWLAAGLVSMGWLWPGRNFTYVVTDQRCFRLSFRRGRINVHDVFETPTDYALDDRDLDELERRIAALSRGGAGGRAGQRRTTRELPRRLREAVQRQLAPNERLLWADQPNPRDYFMHAPLSPVAVMLIMAMAVTTLVALIASSPVLKLASAITAANCALSAAAILWRQVRGTVYALTDQRGIVVSPGGRVTTYAAALLRSFQRTQDSGGNGRLEHQGGLLDDGVGFYGLRNAKLVDDLIKNRTTQEHGAEVVPIESPAGRGDEVSS